MSKTRNAWIVYTLLRLLFFAAPFALVYALGLALNLSTLISAIVAAIIAALIGVSLSVLLLSNQRRAASESIYAWRNRTRTADDIVEDEAVDAADGTADGTAGETVDAAGTADDAEHPERS